MCTSVPHPRNGSVQVLFTLVLKRPTSESFGSGFCLVPCVRSSFLSSLIPPFYCLYVKMWVRVRWVRLPHQVRLGSDPSLRGSVC